MVAAEIEITKRLQGHLEKDLVIWMTSVGRNGRPHAVPVWFWWDGHSFLIYSLPGQKVRDVEGNPNVELHLNTDRSGGFVARFDGVAEIVAEHAPAYRVTRYVAKYRERMKGYGWTPKVFSDLYHVAIRVRPTRLRA